MKSYLSYSILLVTIGVTLAKIIYPNDEYGRFSKQIPKISATKLHPNVLRIAESNNHFALEVYRLLSRESSSSKNLAFCPVSLTTLVSMLYLGATGNTASEINATLGYYATGLAEEELSEAFRMATDVLTSKTNGSSDYRTQLRLASSIWLRKSAGSSVEKAFSDSLVRYFDASVKEVDDFSKRSSVEEVNRWVTNATSGLITNVLEQSLPSSTRLLLMSAVYFKSSWETEFNPIDTKQGRFINGGARFRKAYSMVPMMKVRLQARYGRNEAIRADVVELPYKERQVSMLVIVPFGDGSLDTIESQMNPQTLLELVAGMKKTNVALTLPRFEIRDTIFMKETLSRLGLVSLFDPKDAELGGIDPRGDLYVSEVVQKVVIKVDEEGSEAAAISTSIFSKKKIQQLYNVTADRPFMFLIGHIQTGAILFMGRVANL